MKDKLPEDKTSKYVWHTCIQCDKKRRVIREPKSKLCRSCYCASLKLEGNNAWKGGHYNDRGYSYTKLSPDSFFYPMANKDSYIYEHRLVMAKHLGRCLHTWEIVHHKHIQYPAGSFEDKQDNRIENLQLVTDDRHTQITLLENKIDKLENKIDKLMIDVRLLRLENKQLKEANYK